MSKKMKKEDLLKSKMLSYIDLTKQTFINADTFWQPRMDELLPFYKEYLAAHPDDLDFVLKGYAYHAWKYALQQR